MGEGGGAFSYTVLNQHHAVNLDVKKRYFSAFFSGDFRGRTRRSPVVHQFEQDNDPRKRGKILTPHLYDFT